MKICKIENCNNPVWGNGLCKNHSPHKRLQSTRKSSAEETNLLHQFFISIWNKRRHVSEVSGEKLLSPPSSTYFHHILAKEKYKDACFDEENVVLLTPDEHANVEINCFRYDKINEKRLHLKQKYGLLPV